MRIVSKGVIIGFVLADILLAGWIFFHNHTVPLLEPQGLIAEKEKQLIVAAVGLMLLVIIPIVLLTFFTAWKYKAGKSAAYLPDWTTTKLGAILIWVLPTLLVIILAVIGWIGAHQLDPYRVISSSVKPITVQVVALRWKWLFIYPEQNIATVNFLEIPQNTPVSFQLTADEAPMSSFWIPSLGGQMYEMQGMVSRLNLIANNKGTFTGSAAEINGEGFADMRFSVISVSQNDFDSWIQSVKESGKRLNAETYNALVAPSQDNPVVTYSSVEKDLYNTIVMRYMKPSLNHMFMQ